MNGSNLMERGLVERPEGVKPLRLAVAIRGAVQGVGFRPFVFRLAEEEGLLGWVVNDAGGVRLEVEGQRSAQTRFLERLQTEVPARGRVAETKIEWLEPAGFTSFEIRASDSTGAKTVVVLPDVATCPACLAEIRDPGDRRFGYPFTNCTDCGPRFSIVESVPYDRPNTTMRRFEMCERCAREYSDPRDRRFHAQPNACGECGPGLEMWNRGGAVLAVGPAALAAAGEALKRGRVVAVKGLGGFHLMVDATHEEAVAELRRRKRREQKPLAIMVGDLDGARDLVVVTDEVAGLLGSHEAPIVLADRRLDSPVAVNVAPGNPTLGVMLAYTPLHHQLLAGLPFPVVATSANLSDEPIAIDNHEALERLGGIADDFLVHDRPIARHVDDSVVAIVAGASQPLRRARGQAPMPITLGGTGPSLLALGGHFKNTVGVAFDDRVVLSQHLGDMETPQAFAAFEAAIADLLAMYEIEPAAIVCDSHPDYPASEFGRRLVAGKAGSETWKRSLAGLPLLEVQHHHAHLAACLAEHRSQGPCLGVTWDGTGYGPDGTVWGGEFLLGDEAGFERVARLRPFRLLGGEAAVKQPWRVALALLWELHGERALELRDLPAIATQVGDQAETLARMASTGLRSPWTSSAGRLFDGVASLCGLSQEVAFEGQAAMGLEFASRGVSGHGAEAYPVDLGRTEGGSSMIEIDWRPLVAGVLADVRAGRATSHISASFHRGLTRALVRVAVEMASRHGVSKAALSGGCFQNRTLTEAALAGLEESGFEVMIHRQVPANDGGLSLGQLAVGRALIERSDH